MKKGSINDMTWGHYYISKFKNFIFIKKGLNKDYFTFELKEGMSYCLQFDVKFNWIQYLRFRNKKNLFFKLEIYAFIDRINLQFREVIFQGEIYVIKLNTHEKKYSIFSFIKHYTKKYFAVDFTK